MPETTSASESDRAPADSSIGVDTIPEKPLNIRAPRSLIGIALLLLIAVGVTTWRTKTLALAWYWYQTRAEAEHWRAHGVWLPDYWASVDGLPIKGITVNASGLTWSSVTNTLFTVINGPPAVAELSVDGVLLRKIPIEGARDPEGITHVRDNVFVISDERDHTLYKVTIDDDTTQLDVRAAPHLGISIDLSRNLGYEGISWDDVGGRLFITKEKTPMRVLIVSGFPDLVADVPFQLRISEWKSPRASTLFMTDLSSLTVHEPTGNILLLSDESALIVEYTEGGKPVSVLPLWRGRHGLSRRVPQAEGLAVAPNGDIFVLSEPNLFYRFERKHPASWAQTGKPASSDNVSDHVLDRSLFAF